MLVAGTLASDQGPCTIGAAQLHTSANLLQLKGAQHSAPGARVSPWTHLMQLNHTRRQQQATQEQHKRPSAMQSASPCQPSIGRARQLFNAASAMVAEGRQHIAHRSLAAHHSRAATQRVVRRAHLQGCNSPQAFRQLMSWRAFHSKSASGPGQMLCTAALQAKRHTPSALRALQAQAPLPAPTT